MAVLLGRLDRTTGDLVSQAEAVQGKRPARAGGGGAGTARAGAAARKDPPASNRGVKSPPNRKTGGKRVGSLKVRGSA
jgi:hypothetical protein